MLTSLGSFIGKKNGPLTIAVELERRFFKTIKHGWKGGLMVHQLILYLLYDSVMNNIV